ncbi:MAG: ribonuclease III [Clostridia bacterium]|nr:ribonuclease III [Clostridia bacterium]NCC43376.1 ribonuclease III [Clostridia bacterium]
MEESISYLKEQFQLEDQDIRSYSPLALAYIGDGIYELYIRTILVQQGNCQASKLHKRASRLVKATAQSQMIDVLEPVFTPEEEAVYKRGRNAKSYSTAKNATTGEYRRATGFEAVMGYLYLTGQYCRMIDLIKIGMEELSDGK